MHRAPGLLALSLLLLSACNRPTPHAAAPTTTTTSPSLVTFAGKAHISGTLTKFSAPNALTDPLPAPFTLTVPDAGRGGFQISGADVDGDNETIVWSGGRPLPVTGACKLDVGDAPVELAAAGATFALDGGVRALTAGDCMFNSSVAVGSGGIAETDPSVSFVLHSDSTFNPTGGTAVTVSPVRHFEGHHGSATAAGAFVVTTASGDTWHATNVAMGNGTWILDVTKTATNALHVEAQFDGPVTIRRS